VLSVNQTILGLEAKQVLVKDLGRDLKYQKEGKF